MTRALVLGGGGVAGIAWEIGILTGLADAGVDVTAAERVIGTSAGSAVGAQVTSGLALPELFERQVSPALLDSEIAVDFDIDRMTREMGEVLAGVAPGPGIRRALCDYALAADTVAEPVRRAAVEARVPVPSWPQRDLRIVAIDALSGQDRVFTAADGVDLVDAVAASCAVPGVWPPVTIGGRRFVDGGRRSTTNVDLAADCDRVLLVAPMPDLPFGPPDLLAARDALLQQPGVAAIRPDEASTAAIGGNPLDPAAAAPSARAGRAQAAAHAAEVAAMWT